MQAYRFGHNDIVRVVANKSLHKFNIGDLVVVFRVVVRKDGSHFYQAVNDKAETWGLTEEEVEAAGRVEETEVVE